MTEAKETSVKSKFETLNELVIEWGVEKGIINGTEIAKFKQFAKVVEEWNSETLADIEKQDEKKIIDGIGDTCVTIIILAEQNGLKVASFNPALMDYLKNDVKYGQDLDAAIYQVSVHIGKIGKSLLKGDALNFGSQVVKVLFFLSEVALWFNTNLTNCLEIAYNEIKDRKGKTKRYIYKASRLKLIHMSQPIITAIQSQKISLFLDDEMTTQERLDFLIEVKNSALLKSKLVNEMHFREVVKMKLQRRKPSKDLVKRIKGMVNTN